MMDAIKRPAWTYVRLKMFGVAFDDHGETVDWKIYVGKARMGRVVRKTPMIFEATISGITGKSVCPISAARLAWIAFNEADCDYSAMPPAS